MPPATTIFAEPALIISAACITAFMPEPHNLLMVTAPVNQVNLFGASLDALDLALIQQVEHNP